MTQIAGPFPLEGKKNSELPAPPGGALQETDSITIRRGSASYAATLAMLQILMPSGQDGQDGVDGADGRTIRSGSGAPGAGLGVDGDFYINTAAWTIYGPKTSGAWGSPTSLVGPGGGGSVSIINDLTTGGTSAALSAQQGVALKALVDGKPDLLGELTISQATTLSIASHAMRPIRYDGTTATKPIPSDAGASAIFFEFSQMPDSAGALTVTTPDGRTNTTAPDRVIGFLRVGVNQWVTYSSAPGSMTGAQITTALDAHLGGSAWRTPMSGTEIVAAIDTNQGGSAWRSAMTGAQIEAALNAHFGSTTWQGGGSSSPATVLSAVVENATPSVMTLTMSQALTSADPTGAGGFTLASSGSAITVTAVDVNGTTVTLTLSRAVVFGETLTRSYNSASASVPLANGNGNVANFTGATVTNNVAGTAPTFTARSVENSAPNVLTLTSSVALTSADPSGAGGLVLTASGGPVTITAVDVNGTTTTCSLSRSITNGETMTLAYTSGSSSVPFASTGGAMANFSGAVVTNNVASSGGGAVTVTDSRSTFADGVLELTSATLTPTGTNRAIFGLVGNNIGGGGILEMRRGGSGGTLMTRLGPDQNYDFGQGLCAAFAAAGVPAADTTLFGDWTTEVAQAFVGGVAFSNVNQTTPFDRYDHVLVQNGDPVLSMAVPVVITGTQAGEWYVVGVDWSSGNGTAQAATAGSGTTLLPNQAVGFLGGQFFMVKQATGTTLQLDATVSQLANGSGEGNYLTARCHFARVNPP